MIALAAPCPFSGFDESVLAIASIPDLILSIGRFAPITPVEQIKTFSGLHGMFFATASAVSLQSCKPFSPVHAFATPALTTIALKHGEVWINPLSH